MNTSLNGLAIGLLILPLLAGVANGAAHHPAGAPPTRHGPAETPPSTASTAPATNSPSPASQVDSLISTNLIKLKSRPGKAAPDRLAVYHDQVEHARDLRRRKESVNAARVLVELLEQHPPPEFQRAALFELALVAQEENQLARAQQVLAQYLNLFPKDPGVPEVLLRQGLIYRQMGANQLAISKFYAVMSSALTMKLDQFDYYTRLVLQAQTEIADTHLLQGQFSQAADFYARLLKQKEAELNRPLIHFKLIRCLAGQDQHAEVVHQAGLFERQHAGALELADVRFLHAQSLKQLGRTTEALEQVFKLLEAQRRSATNAPDTWVYWRQRVGNNIANQLYQEGDYLNALELYTRLAEMDASPAWQWPAWYQIGLIHEHLNQPQKALEIYDALLARQKELTESGASPSLKSVLDMAKWRKDHLTWRGQVEMAAQSLRLDSLPRPATNAPHARP